jgi:hypothetical protein
LPHALAKTRLFATGAAACIIDAGIVFATIPDATGVIRECYMKGLVTPVLV